MEWKLHARSSIRSWSLAIQRRLIAASVLALLAACHRTVAPAVAPTASRAAVILPTAADRTAADYIGGAVGDELFEVQTAEIAANRATHPNVRAYARLITKDYTASRSDLDQAIAKSRLGLATPTGMSDHLQSLLDELGEGAGSDFDKTYIDQQIEAQEDTLRLTSAYAQTGEIPAIKAAASQLTPKIQAHLDQARSIEDALNKTL